MPSAAHGPEPLEGRWERYRREVREARDLLAPFHATLSGDLLRAYDAVLAWQSSPRRALPPEPEATRVRSAASMLRAGTLTLD